MAVITFFVLNVISYGGTQLYSNSHPAILRFFMPAGPEIPTSVMGTIPVSNLDPEDDHQLVIQVIREYLKHLYVKARLGIGTQRWHRCHRDYNAQ